MRFYKSPQPSRRAGFTLIEAAMAQVIVSFAVVAMCELLASGTAVNAGAADLTTAVQLANNIHEIAVGLPFDDTGGPVVGRWHDVWDLNGLKFSPPIDVDRAPIRADENWTQEVSVTGVDEKQIGSPVEHQFSTPTARLQVTIYHNGRYVYDANWLVVAAPTP
jgi:Tfp pilus assembly protein PilV